MNTLFTSMLSIVGTILCACVVARGDAPAPTPVILLPEAAETLAREDSARFKEYLIKQVDRFPLYQRVAFAKATCRVLKQQLRGDIEKPRKLHLARLATDYVELSLQIKLTPLRENDSEDEVIEHLQLTVEAFASGVIQSRSIVKVEDVVAKYRVPIAPIDKAAAKEAMQRCLEFFRDVPPLGQDLSVMLNIMGKPVEQHPNAAVFRFDNGLGGYEVVLIDADGIVTDVQIRSID